LTAPTPGVILLGMSKVVVLTGASSGIGAALARRLGKQGCRLVLAARRADRLLQVVAEAGNGAVSIVTDVTRRPEVLRLRDEAFRRFGRINVWINNAGRGISRPVLDLTDAELDEMMAVNVKSALYGMQAVLPHFQERGDGHLINVSSFLTRVPLVSTRAAYTAAKAALNALTAGLRADLRVSHPDVHVSLVLPGMVGTDFAASALNASPSVGPPRPNGPMQMQTADEVAAVIADLIEHPAAEVYTSPTLPELARSYLQDVSAFESRAARR
jgi:short-subunit dehydrogenase